MTTPEHTITPTIEQFRAIIAELSDSLKYEHPHWNNPKHKEHADNCATCVAINHGERI